MGPDAMPMYKAKGEGEGSWWAFVRGERFPCVFSFWVTPRRPGAPIYSYDDITFAMASKKQKDEYIQAIGRGVVCHTVGGPIVGESKFKRLGYDAVWEIVPGLLNENEIRFSYKHKVCDLSDNNGRRVPGRESLTPYPAFGNCPLTFGKFTVMAGFGNC